MDEKRQVNVDHPSASIVTVTTSHNISELRKDYARSTLSESDVDPDPFRQFDLWFSQATAAELPEPYAMALATATADGHPSVRMVLLRGVDERGFAFFTNYDSRKAIELEANPQAALLFFWHELERQVRIEGHVERVADTESDRYFHSRPASSKVGAWASPQSQVIPGRDALETRVRDYERQFPDADIPRPANWGGYRVIPRAFEFWQGRPSRLHDRLRYTRQLSSNWLIERLAP
jgi:pyridoxamine 5'-phosphate oxidase